VPKTTVIFYQEPTGISPVIEWLKKLKSQDQKGFNNCLFRIKQLEDSGYELRRPIADYLTDGIYELRAKHQNIQYRILYFFHGQNIAIIAHSIIKKTSAVPPSELEQAIVRKNKFIENPEIYSYEGEELT
jgi:phage-related protein